MSRSTLVVVSWLLRVAVAMCFIGHGAFGILQKREWLVFFNTFGIGDQGGEIAALVRPADWHQAAQ